MHMCGPALSTTRYHRRKRDLSASQLSKLQEQHRAHNKFLKQHRLATLSFDDYLAYLDGRIKKSKPVKATTTSPIEASSPRRDSGSIPSLSTTGVPNDPNACAAKPAQKYTGTLITGIATMHKSNAVPVINKKQAEEISNMRRGG